MDLRLKLLVTIAAIATIAALSYAAWFWWVTCLSCQFGDPADWPEHVTDINNIAFRYPPGFEIIVPDDEVANPVSVVKAGERGESVLVQVGTWRPGEEFENIEQVGDRYEKAVSRRTALSRERFNTDGNDGVLIVQDEVGSNRRIVEAFVWDVAEGDTATSVREISLQLPGIASAVERTLYEKVFRVIVASLDFITERGRQSGENLSFREGIPESWKEFISESGGFSLWRPADWTVGGSDLPRGSDLDISTLSVVFTSPDGTATYSVRALPQDRTLSLDELDAEYAQEFRASAVGEEPPQASAFGLADGTARGLSYEARLPKDGLVDKLLLEQTTKLAYLVVLVKGGGDDPHGRGYVIEASFSGGTQSERARSADARRITRSLRLLP